MFNKKIIICLLLCMPKILGMHNSLCITANERSINVLDAEYEKLKDNLTTICSNLKKRCKTASAADIAEFTTSVITEIIISGKVQGATGKFLANQVPKIGPTFQRVSRLVRNGLKPEMAERAVFASAEGVEVAIPRDFVEAVEIEQKTNNIILKTENTTSKGYQITDKGSTLRNVDYMHGLKHAIDKHFFDRLGKYKNFALKNLDPLGNPEKWINFVINLAQSGDGISKSIPTGEIIEIWGKMPKTGGSFLDVGVRMFKATGSEVWILTTVLT